MLWEFLEHYHGIRYTTAFKPLWIVCLATIALLAGAAWKGREQRAEGKEALHPLHPLHLSHLFLLALIVLMTSYQHSEQSGAHFSDRRTTCSSPTWRRVRACCSLRATCTWFNCARGVLCSSTRARSTPSCTRSKRAPPCSAYCGTFTGSILQSASRRRRRRTHSRSLASRYVGTLLARKVARDSQGIRRHPGACLRGLDAATARRISEPAPAAL